MFLPEEVEALKGEPVTQLALGSEHSMALTGLTSQEVWLAVPAWHPDVPAAALQM